jgi:hypothetical protein
MGQSLAEVVRIGTLLWLATIYYMPLLTTCP